MNILHRVVMKEKLNSIMERSELTKIDFWGLFCIIAIAIENGLQICSNFVSSQGFSGEINCCKENFLPFLGYFQTHIKFNPFLNCTTSK